MVAVVLVVLVLGGRLGKGWGRGGQQGEQGQGGGGDTHRSRAERGYVVRCTLPQQESQVAEVAPLRIGSVASRSGLTVKTIRFYCEEGLIHPVGRSEGGYRLFAESVLAELALIRTLRAMELPLPDVRQVLEARRSGLCTCNDLKARIRLKAGEIGERITALQHLQTELVAMLSSWEACGGNPAGS